MNQDVNSVVAAAAAAVGQPASTASINLSHASQVSPVLLERLQRSLNPIEPACSVEAELIEYRGRKIAAFQSDDDLLLCLPQAYELFLKQLVSGLHTVYTKLKRLDIVPTVCNVEQVRALRSIGAIQPGVNRCKLISCADFDLLYEDCASSCSRPGRPPKRNSCDASSYQSQVHKAESMNSTDMYSVGQGYGSCKRAKANDEERSTPRTGAASNSTSDYALSALGGLLNVNGFSQQLFPFFPIAAQQLLFNQLLATVGQKPVAISPTWNASTGGCQSSNDAETSAFELPLLSHGRLNSAASSEDFTSSKNQNAHSSSQQELFRRATAVNDHLSAGGGEFSLEQLLISIAGMVELAVAAARRQEEQFQKEKEETLSALENERRKRVRLEITLKEKERFQKACMMRIKSLKTVISQLKPNCQNGASPISQLPEEAMENPLLSPEEASCEEGSVAPEESLKSESEDM